MKLRCFIILSQKKGIKGIINNIIMILFIFFSLQRQFVRINTQLYDIIIKQKWIKLVRYIKSFITIALVLNLYIKYITIVFLVLIRLIDLYYHFLQITNTLASIIILLQKTYSFCKNDSIIWVASYTSIINYFKPD